MADSTQQQTAVVLAQYNINRTVRLSLTTCAVYCTQSREVSAVVRSVSTRPNAIGAACGRSRQQIGFAIHFQVLHRNLVDSNVDCRDRRSREHYRVPSCNTSSCGRGNAHNRRRHHFLMTILQTLLVSHKYNSL